MSDEQHGISEKLAVIEHEAPTPQTIETLEKIILSTEPIRQLERLGEQLTLAHLLALSQRWNQPGVTEKWEGRLSALLVGIPQKLFNKFLLSIPAQQMGPLIQETSGEPLMHHLTLLVHEEEQHLYELSQNLVELERNILHSDPDTEESRHIPLLFQKLNTLSDNCRESILLLDKALMLAWNGPRGDLVEKLSLYKERFQRFDSQIIGDSPNLKEKPTGLYALLQKRLDKIFDASDSNGSGIEALRDGDPAIEALAKFSLWYLEDYVEIGLLPTVKSVEQIQTNLKQLNREERAIYRLERFREAKGTLEKCGLHTIADLKRAHIFSAEALKEFLKNL